MEGPPVEKASSGAGYGSRYLKLKPGMQVWRVVSSNSSNIGSLHATAAL